MSVSPWLNCRRKGRRSHVGAYTPGISHANEGSTVRDVNEWKVAVVGAGTMGLCIAQSFAMHGHEVNLYNRTPGNLAKAMSHIRSNMEALVDYGMAEEGDVDAVLSRIHDTSDLGQAVGDADYIVENVAERPDVKAQVFAQIDAAARPDAVIGSDTSSMDIYQFVKVSNPGRLVITHFFNPAYVMPLVEVVRGPETADETVASVREFLEAAGKQVAVLNSVIPGFIINRFTAALCREACSMVEQGYATFEDIDKAIVATYGPRFTFEGPCQLGDFVGLDVSAYVFNNIFPTLCNAETTSPVILDMVGKGKLGVKTGEGLCGSYPDPEQAYKDRDTRVIKTIKAISEVERSM